MDKTNNQSEALKNTLLAITLLLCAVVLFIVLIFALGGNKTKGTIAVAEQTVRGVEQEFVYSNDSLQQGDTVEWYVNGVKVDEKSCDGTQSKLLYTPTSNGTLDVKVKVSNKFTKTCHFSVSKPQAQIVAPNLTVTYGDQLPSIVATCNCPVCCDVCCDCVVNCQKLSVGQYTIDFACKQCNNDIETEFVTGTLTVVPRVLQFDDITKQYDGTTTLNAPLVATNVVDGDDVAVSGTLTFLSKNAGEQTLDTTNLSIVGSDACNYVLPQQISATITAKQLTLTNLVVCDKNYDGTTKATICNLGTLDGIISGDSVAIGTINVRFDGAQKGSHHVIVNDVTLVGYDKQNYTLQSITTNIANIN